MRWSVTFLFCCVLAGTERLHALLVREAVRSRPYSEAIDLFPNQPAFPCCRYMYFR